MDPVTIAGLSLAGIVLGGSILRYCIKIAEKERKRKQLLKIRNYMII